MVTDEKDLSLKWDAFVEREVAKQTANPVLQAEALERAKEHIEGFRRIDWPNIKRQLYSEPFMWDVQEGLEPHWVAPGRAVFWQLQTTQKIVQKTFEDGRVRSVKEDVPTGWEPTSSGLPAGSASQISQYLDKGLRLRPPEEGVDVESLKSAIPSGSFQVEAEEEKPSVEYVCARHGFKRYTSATWKNYIRHCAQFNEVPELDAPQEVQEKVADYKYYCYIHNRGYMSQKMATRHIRTEMRKPRRGIHPALEQMAVPEGK